MISHATTERLSLYLDAALEPAERRRVEEHLETCSECRHRLAGLHRVVDGLGRLPAVAPPADLRARVGREIDLRGRRGRWARLLDGQLPGPLAGSPPIHVFALVLALGAIVYLFAFGVEQRRERPTRIVLPAPGAAAPAPPAATAPSLLPPVTPTPTGSERRHLLGGVFEWVDQVWVEEGLAGRRPDDRLSLRLPERAAELDPELTVLAELQAPVRLRVGERVVEIEVEQQPR